MLHHDVSQYQRHPKTTASWDSIAHNQVNFYEQEVVNLDSSRDSVIVVDQVHEQGPLDDALPAPADPPSTPEIPKERVTYGAEDIRYKTPKRTDRTPSTCTSTSSSEGSWTPSYTRGRGRSPFVRGGGRGRTSPSPTANTFRTPGLVTRSNSRNAYDRSQASTKEKQRKKDAAVVQRLVTTLERGKTKPTKKIQLPSKISKVR